jgi:hypothetical protein
MADYEAEDQAWDIDNKLRDGDIALFVELHDGGIVLRRWKSNHV